jgi:alkylation response protein AidB-like acyl-CoA dehydrogenase
VTALFSPIELPLEAQVLRSEVRAFLSDHLPQGTHFTQSSPAFSRKMGERGWIGMTWPSRWGGGEHTGLERYVVVEEMLAAGAPIFFNWFGVI